MVSPCTEESWTGVRVMSCPLPRTVPASCGRIHRHRLIRGGDRVGDNALHAIVFTRMRFGVRIRSYVARRTKEGLK